MKMIVPDSWDVPAVIRDRFGDSAGQQRAMSADGHLLLVLHHPPDHNARERKATLFWRNPSGAWVWNKDGSMTNLLKIHLATFSASYDKLEKQFQTASCAEHYFQLLQAVMPLCRASRHLHKTLQQAREMVPTDHEIIVARDTASDIERGFELLQLDAKNGLDYTIAHKAELQSQSTLQMARSAHRLNLLAALFFPITAISSVFGMNVSHGLESLPSGYLFWGLLSSGFLCGLLLTRVVAQKPTTVDMEPTRSRSLGNAKTETGKWRRNSVQAN
jgi:hypothetical protein